MIPSEFGAVNPHAIDQSGILPCFFLGFESRLFSSARKEVIRRARVSRGSITASI